MVIASSYSLPDAILSQLVDFHIVELAVVGCAGASILTRNSRIMIAYMYMYTDNWGHHRTWTTTLELNLSPLYIYTKHDGYAAYIVFLKFVGMEDIKYSYKDFHVTPRLES
jgi:hypothetical protein